VGLETNIHGKWIHQFIGWSSDHEKVLAQRNVYAVTGAALLTRRVLWNKVGGFDEDYGLGTYEDTSFCLSVRELGYNIVVVPEAKGTHYTGATAEKYGIPYPMDRNRMIFLQKWQHKLAWTEWKAY
jgi:GT2 family glycosyltransferase